MKVLLAIDFSRGSQAALEEVAARPWSKGTEFLVLHVIDVHAFAHFAAVIEDARSRTEQLVRAAAENLTRAGHKCACEVCIGTPRKGIVDFAREWKANLIILGSHGHSAIGRFLLGSVAQGVLHAAPCSVEIVRPPATASPASAHGLKILLATDGSGFSSAAAKSVAARPWPAESQVKVLSVQELPVFENQTTAFPLAAVYPASLLEELLENAASQADESVQKTRTIFADTGLHIVDSGCTPLGDPRLTILEQAEEWPADLIVLGSHGRRGLDLLLTGSVSQAVAVHARCSVEVIRLDQAVRTGNKT